MWTLGIPAGLPFPAMHRIDHKTRKRRVQHNTEQGIGAKGDVCGGGRSARRACVREGGRTDLLPVVVHSLDELDVGDERHE